MTAFVAPVATPGQVLLAVLDGTGTKAADVGGKAAGLDRLALHGFPIPPSLAVTVAAYRRFVAESGLSGWLASLASAPLPGPADLDSAAAEVEERFVAAPMPQAVIDAIRAGAAPLIGAGRVAVRSSATAEDLGTASFAGQYRSFVGVGDLDGVIDSVRRCWASLWLPAVRAYRRHNQIPDDDLAMGVVIQAMVEADWSGVGFTRDPDGSPDVMRIEVVPGLGEGLVSGRLTPSDFAVARRTLQIRGNGGVDPPPFLEDLARLLLQVEFELDEPQDVEWACVDSRLVLLQARPITVAGPTTALDDGFDGPCGTLDTYTPSGVVEMLPGVVPPLLWTMSAPMIENGFRQVIASLGDLHLEPDRRFVGRFRGRAALNLSALGDAADALPGGSPAEVERQFLGHPLSEEPPTTRHRRMRPAAVMRMRRARSLVADDVELTTAAAAGIVNLDVDLAALPARRLLAYRHTVRDLAWRLTAAEVAASSAAAAAYRGLELTLRRWLEPDEAATWAQRLTAGNLAELAVGVSVTRRLQRVVDEALAEAPGLRNALVAGPPGRSRERICQLGEPGHRLAVAVTRIARTQGARSIYGGPTWAEDEELLWEQVAAHAAGATTATPPTGTTTSPEQLLEQLRTRPGWMGLRIATGQIVDLRLRWVRRQVEEAVRFLGLRERAKTALLILGGEERRIIVEAERRLVRSGRLPAVGDVMLLADGELEAMILGGAGPSGPVMHRRRVVGGACADLPGLGVTFTGDPGVERRPAPAGSAVLEGWAASPGIVTGTARVVRSLGEGSELAEGDILVATSTDPSWTPLLLTAAGLVLEEGGPLSHGAIVAREFGVPAVLNIPGVVDAVVDGERLEVDGFTGRVRRLVREEVTVG